ncbi:MAG: sigma-70 family RNA polymerase sigma factor [Bdellovibrionales bacterium]|nr:sigma-70 family RNA polymerase sigma factor [Bdellovibrionales bacterium]
MAESKAQMSDEDLMTLFKDGDMESFEVLYGRYSSRVYGFILKRLDSQVAQDLLQDVFLKIHNNRDKYSNHYPFLPWLFAITRNVVIDFVRLNESKVRSRAGELQEVASSEVSDEWSGELTAALATLPVQQRRAIEFRYKSDWTFEQIASELKTTPTNVRQIISRGIRKLREKGGFFEK